MNVISFLFFAQVASAFLMHARLPGKLRFNLQNFQIQMASTGSERVLSLKEAIKAQLKVEESNDEVDPEYEEIKKKIMGDWKIHDQLGYGCNI